MDSKSITAAASRLKGTVRRTPLDKWGALSTETGADVYLKCEHLQHTGSFKFRGASNAILSLDEAEREKGVIAASSGNHGLAVAKAAAMAGIPATIYVPEDASPVKIDGIRAFGGQVVAIEDDALAAEIMARAVAEEEGKCFISPYNDPNVIAGQGTLGVELWEQLPEIGAVFVSVGGGGLIGGIGAYLKSVKPNVEIVGCWPENAPAMHVCLEAGEIIEVEERPTLSDGTAGGVEPGAITLELCQNVIDRHILVSEDEIKTAMKRILAEERWIVEGAAGVAAAAFMSVARNNPDDYRGKAVAIVLCGRNIAVEKFLGAVGTECKVE